MLTKVWRAALVVGILSLLTGADTCTETKVTPNPPGGGNNFNLQANGTFATANRLVGIVFSASLVNANPPQITSTNAVSNVPNGTWSATEKVAPADYDCFGTLITIDNNGNTTDTKSNTIRVTVK